MKVGTFEVRACFELRYVELLLRGPVFTQTALTASTIEIGVADSELSLSPPEHPQTSNRPVPISTWLLSPSFRRFCSRRFYLVSSICSMSVVF